MSPERTGGVSTAPPEPLSGVSDLHLALAPTGKAFAVWQAVNGTRWVIKATTRPAGRPGS